MEASTICKICRNASCLTCDYNAVSFFTLARPVVSYNSNISSLHVSGRGLCPLLRPPPIFLLGRGVGWSFEADLFWDSMRKVLNNLQSISSLVVNDAPTLSHVVFLATYKCDCECTSS